MYSHITLYQAFRNFNGSGGVWKYVPKFRFTSEHSGSQEKRKNPSLPPFLAVNSRKWRKRDYMNKFRIPDCQGHIPNCALLLVVCSACCKMKTMTIAATCFNCFIFCSSSCININVHSFPSWTLILKYYIKNSNKEYKTHLSVKKSIYKCSIWNLPGSFALNIQNQ